MEKELYIIRHGETDFNRQGIVQGRGVNSDLNAMGVAQAEAFYEHYKHIPFDKVYTSSLKRTHQTVKKFWTTNCPGSSSTGSMSCLSGYGKAPPTKASGKVLMQM
ncbi:histidine phosphatase family protein [Chitinophaga sedimenti]|uniref:histidine phosphatase family protein n=1 Tax=Chitinophaga sedimenti TaxID=2033606 RepID=UPI00249DBC2C|nr:histidine phosphatase family protein [Chitinophaga sedimenti]